MSPTFTLNEGEVPDSLARGAEGGAELIQVCADASDPATAERELRALVEAGEVHPKASKRLLTLTRDGKPAEAPHQISAVDEATLPPQRLRSLLANDPGAGKTIMAGPSGRTLMRSCILCFWAYTVDLSERW